MCYSTAHEPGGGEGVSEWGKREENGKHTTVNSTSASIRLNHNKGRPWTYHRRQPGLPVYKRPTLDILYDLQSQFISATSRSQCSLA